MIHAKIKTRGIDETMNELRENRIENINTLYQIDIGVIFENNNKIINDILTKLPEIDDLIMANLTNYTIDRLSYYDRAIIRFAVYEIKYLNVPKAIAINEAIEITKIYTDLDDEKQHKFTNRLLDNISKNI